MAADFNSMTVAQLRLYAKENGIRLSQYDKTKADIIQAIKRSELNNVPEEYKNKTVAELKAYADENKIEIPSKGKKADIIAAIVKAESKEVTAPVIPTQKLRVTLFQTKPGRTVLENHDYSFMYSFRLGVYTICPRCGEEVYASCYTRTDEETANKYPKISDQIKNCPKCKSKLGLIEGRYIQEYIGKNDTPKYMSAFAELKNNIIEADRDSLREKAKQYIEKIQNKDAKTNSVRKHFSLEELKQYILYLIHMESEIYYLNERLVEIQMKKLENNQGYTRAQIIVNTKVDRDFHLIDKTTADEIRSLKQIISHPESVIDKNSIIVEIDHEKPVEPAKPAMAKPEVPQEPIYKKPGLFNKKKVISENEANRKEYEREKEKYESALSLYKNEQESYLNRLNEYKNEIKKFNSAYKKAYDMAFEKMKTRIIDENGTLLGEKEKEAKELNTKKKEIINEYLDFAPQNRVSALLSFEEREIKKELKKIVSARDELYSYDIIYGKYRNYVALTTLYEYLDSGRCDALEGPEGAYNLFESETRTNEVIVQLKTIVDSLESIKANQFMLYKEMKEVNRNLNAVNASLNRAITEINNLQWTTKQTNAHLAEIGDTAKGLLVTSATTAYNTAVTAHYSAITAHYSKVNAELTNALGFMIAMK